MGIFFKSDKEKTEKGNGWDSAFIMCPRFSVSPTPIELTVTRLWENLYLLFASILKALYMETLNNPIKFLDP